MDASLTPTNLAIPGFPEDQIHPLIRAFFNQGHLAERVRTHISELNNTIDTNKPLLKDKIKQKEILDKYTEVEQVLVNHLNDVLADELGTKFQRDPYQAEPYALFGGDQRDSIMVRQAR
jgi:hypothetical protein